MSTLVEFSQVEYEKIVSAFKCADTNAHRLRRFVIQINNDNFFVNSQKNQSKNNADLTSSQVLIHNVLYLIPQIGAEIAYNDKNETKKEGSANNSGFKSALPVGPTHKYKTLWINNGHTLAYVPDFSSSTDMQCLWDLARETAEKMNIGKIISV